YFVLNRTTGQPMANVSIKASIKIYNNKLKNFTYKDKQYKTDKNGYAFIKDDKDASGGYTTLEFKTSEDYFRPSDGVYSYYRNGQNDESDDEDVDREDFEEKHLKMFFFTDRSIYRPGQTAYFKAIAITKDFKTKLPKVVAGYKSNFFLKDANGENIDSMKVM